MNKQLYRAVLQPVLGSVTDITIYLFIYYFFHFAYDLSTWLKDNMNKFFNIKQTVVCIVGTIRSKVCSGYTFSLPRISIEKKTLGPET